MPARPPPQAAPQVDRRPAPRRHLPVDHPIGTDLHHRADPLPHLAAAGIVNKKATALRFPASRWWGGAVMTGPGDQASASEGRSHGAGRAATADRAVVSGSTALDGCCLL